MYKTYFGIRQKPFSIAPDPSFLFMSEQHREALAHLQYGVECDSGFVLLTGEIGTGKTTICRCLLEQIPTTSDIAYIINPKLSVAELLAAICDEFGIKYPKSSHSIKLFIDRINKFLLESHAKGRSPVLIIDEAQNLSNEVLEQIRLLTNLETNERKLLLIIMIGQPELRHKLASPELTQLQQRITARYHLKPLSKTETAAYISHRLAIAGLKHRLFIKSALRKVYALSQGVPRIINLLCDRAMLGAYAQGKTTINSKTVSMAAHEILDIKLKANPILPIPQLITGSTTLAFILAIFIISPFANLPWLGELVEKIRQPIPAQIIHPDQATAQPPQQDLTNKAISSQGSSKLISSETVNFDTYEQSPFPAEEQTIQDQLNWPQTIPLKESKTLAFSTLFKQWDAPYNPQNHISACKQAEQSGLNCLFKQGNMGSLRRINRPAVMRMINRQGQEYFATIVDLKEDEATLLIGKDQFKVGLTELEQQWSGSYTLLWKIPPDYDKAIIPGESTPWLAWLKQQLAENNKKSKNDHPQTAPQNATLAGNLLDEVKKFQQANGLLADGIVGPQTIISLNSKTSGNHLLPELHNNAANNLLSQRLSDNRGQFREVEGF